ncbi:MAG TPA: hypothetical protein ENJ25_02020 [Firmicutes bacterium]|nr:MAG: hypothetical protein DRN17_05425 [Thermoplasmata archaeon]RLF51985.1 MAG: hypothetical protein DRN11_01870 [Thermoplasmata archaeon]HFD04902.1 hypothetical protein [Bacillota bacterium]
MGDILEEIHRNLARLLIMAVMIIAFMLTTIYLAGRLPIDTYIGKGLIVALVFIIIGLLSLSFKSK